MAPPWARGRGGERRGRERGKKEGKKNNNMYAFDILQENMSKHNFAWLKKKKKKNPTIFWPNTHFARQSVLQL